MAHPRGAEAVERMKRQTAPPGDPVIVVFDGAPTHFDGAVHVYPVEGRAYDWRFLADCNVHIVASKGTDAEPVIRAVAEVCAPYLGVVDPKRQAIAYVINGNNLWQCRRGSEKWLEWFA